MTKNNADNNGNNHIALFVDLENFFGFCKGLGLPVDLAPTLSKLTEMGKVTVRRSFGDIQKFPIPGEAKWEIRRMLQQNMLIHEDIPYQTHYKNSADIRLAVEALSTVFQNGDIDMVAIVGADRDYLPLLHKMRELGKELIGIGGSKDNTPELFVKSCDYFYYHEFLVGSTLAALAEIPVIAPQTEESQGELSQGTLEASAGALISDDAEAETSASRDEALALLVAALRMLEGKGNDDPPGATVIQYMRRIQPDFDPGAYGYKNFKQLCQKAANAGLIELLAHGSNFSMSLAARQEIDVPDGGEVAKPRPEHQVLKKWIEEKIRAKLPGLTMRLTIYSLLHELLQGAPEGLSLCDISKKIAVQLKPKADEQSVYKVLYSLYRGNCFSSYQGATPFNPQIFSFLNPDEEHVKLDKYLISNYMTTHRRECRVVLPPEVWSKVFFNSDSHKEYIKSIADAL